MKDFVKARQVFVDCPMTSREETLDFLAEQAVELGFADDVAAVRAAYDEREAMGVTGVQDGFAIPHAKTAAIKEAGVVIVKLKERVEWPSFDEGPCDVIISLLVPDGEAGTTHLKLLSKIAVMLMREEFRNRVHGENDPEQIAAIINEGLE
jgi:PTS system fructose-specific IIA component